MFTYLDSLYQVACGKRAAGDKALNQWAKAAAVMYDTTAASVLAALTAADSAKADADKAAATAAAEAENRAREKAAIEARNAVREALASDCKGITVSDALVALALRADSVGITLCLDVSPDKTVRLGFRHRNVATGDKPAGRPKSDTLSSNSNKSAWDCVQGDTAIAGMFSREVIPGAKGPGGKPKYLYRHNGKAISGSLAAYVRNVLPDSAAGLEIARYDNAGK